MEPRPGEGQESLSLQSKLSVLAVDDHPQLMEFINGFVRDHVEHFDIVNNGEEAIQKFQEVTGRYNVVVTDLSMGEGRMSGFEVARGVKDIDPTITVVLATAEARNYASYPEEWLRERGVDHVLDKNEAFETASSLMQQIREDIGSRRKDSQK